MNIQERIKTLPPDARVSFMTKDGEDIFPISDLISLLPNDGSNISQSDLFVPRAYGGIGVCSADGSPKGIYRP